MTQTTFDPTTPGLHTIETEEVGHGRLRWGAIFGGTISALGVWALLYALGIALGFSSVNVDDPSSLRASGIFTGIWGLIAPLVALFIGGLVASRAAAVLTRGAGVMHGLVVWGLTTMVAAWLLASVIAAAVGGAVSVGKAAGSAGAAAVGHAAEGAGGIGALAQSLGFSWDDVIAPVNRRLRAEGKPTVTPQQVEAAAKDVVQDAIRQGRLDRQLLTSSIADKTALSRADAEEITSAIEQQLRGAGGSAQRGLADAAQAVQTGALTAVDRTGKAFWGVFGSLLLGMLAAIGGAVFGASERMQAWHARAQLKAYERLPHLRRSSSAGS